MAVERATLAAGCFWGVQAALDEVPGVIDTRVGYMGGSVENPSYEDVCTGQTDHAEVVDVRFDSDKLSYESLLAAFWATHNPTTNNRQGPDVGSQYRSVIFFYDEAQQRKATASKATLEASGKHANPIVTAIEPAATFYEAEEHHQRYFSKQGISACPI